MTRETRPETEEPAQNDGPNRLIRVVGKVGQEAAGKGGGITGSDRKDAVCSSRRVVRRERVAELARLGWSQVRIAEEVGSTPATVYRDLRALSEAWQADAIESRRVWALDIGRRLESVCEAALDGFRDSRRGTVTTRTRYGREGDPLGTESTHKTSAGDPRWLAVLVQASKVQGEVLGISGAGARDAGGVQTPLLVREVIVTDQAQARAMVRFAQLSQGGADFDPDQVDVVDAGPLESSDPGTEIRESGVARGAEGAGDVDAGT